MRQLRSILAITAVFALVFAACGNETSPAPGLGLDKTGTHTFTSVPGGYSSPPEALTVTVRNTGSAATGAVTITLSGIDAASFTLSKTRIEDISAGGTDTFTVQPNAGLADKTYTATVSVSGGGLSASFTVSFTAGLLTGTVSVDGTAKNGETLTVNTASLDGSGAITYQWKRDGAAIDSAVNETYTLATVDEGAAITVEVSRAGYTGTVESAATVPVAGYALGETGPAGGKIFYTEGTGGWKYLEAAPADISEKKAWASPDHTSTNIPGAAGTAIGSGKANTAAILAVDANAPAAKACADYNYGGFDDWFLPSKDELHAMYNNRTVIGGFASNWYHSSSLNTANDYSWGQNFNGGRQDYGNKTNAYFVRAIRAF